MVLFFRARYYRAEGPGRDFPVEVADLPGILTCEAANGANLLSGGCLEGSLKVEPGGGAFQLMNISGLGYAGTMGP